MAKQNYIDRPPRIQPELPQGEFQIPSPPEFEENATQPLLQVALPIITIIGYVLVAVLGRGSSSMVMIVPMAIAVIASTGIALYTYFNDKRLRAEIQVAYTQRLTELRRAMENDLEKQRTFYHYNYPDPEKTARIALDIGQMPGSRIEDIRSGSRLWERRFYDSDFGRIRLGVGTLPSTVIYRMTDEVNYNNPMMREAVRLAEDSQYVESVPVTIPLKQQGENVPGRFAIGVTGSSPAMIYEYMRTLLIDYTTYHSPNDTHIYVVGSNEAKNEWRWAYNLPHCRENDRSETLCFEADKNTQDPKDSERMRLLLKNLRNVLERRKIRLGDKDQSKDVDHPFLLLIVDVLKEVPGFSALSDLEAENAISTILQDGQRLGASVIFLVPSRSKVPSPCQAVLEVDPDPADGAAGAAADKMVFRYAEVGVNSQRFVGSGSVIRGQERAREIARQLESLSVRSSYGVDLATTVGLMEMVNVTNMDQLQEMARGRWQNSKKPELADWLYVPVGRMAGNDLRTLVFSAKADGVHGLVAGSTGSGKSELLTTLILGLAINFDPSIINFVLVDYKGGSAFEPFRKLPHCVDIVTNLEGSATSRLFAAINAELDRRQRLNTFSDSKDIVHYRQKGLHLKEEAPPYPHLFIIIDEFAEMIAGNPEFKSQLESITRLGRSLGVTLILAAQRPSGVTDQMRANIKFRICLRVETPEDSRELLRRSDAAFLPPGIPGRGYLQVGNENIELIQTAYSGGDYRGSQETEKPNVVWLDRKKAKKSQGGEEAPKLFSVVIDMLSNLATKESEPQWRPWPAFLPKRFSLETPIDMGYMNEGDISLIQAIAGTKAEAEAAAGAGSASAPAAASTDRPTGPMKATLPEAKAAPSSQPETKASKPIDQTNDDPAFAAAIASLKTEGARNLPADTTAAEPVASLPAADAQPAPAVATAAAKNTPLTPQIPLNSAITRALAGDVDWEGVNWETTAMRPVVGLIDNPYAAKQIPLVVNFPTGHAVIFGASGWGKTTFVRTALTSLTVTHSPAELQVYILDFGGRNLSMFHDLPHVGAIITSDEEERVQRLMRHLGSLLEERQLRLSEARINDIYTYNQAQQKKNGDIIPAVLVVIDNFAEFKENFDSLMPTLTSLVREGRAYGIHFLFTADQPNSISGKLFNLITERMTLKLTDPSEYTSIVGRGVPDMGNIPGRGFIRIGRTPLEFQTALPVDDEEEGKLKRADEVDTLQMLIRSLKAAWPESGARPASIKTLDLRVPLESLLAEPRAAVKRIMPALGYDDRDLSVYKLDLEKFGPHLIVVGPPNSGKTTVMRTLALALAHTYSPDEVMLVLVDFQKRLFAYGGERTLEDLPHVAQVVSKADQVKELVENLKVECPLLGVKKRKVYLLVDNYDSFSDECSRGGIHEAFGVLAREYGTGGFHVVISGSPAIISTADDLRKQVSASSFGMALQSADAVGRINGKMPRSLVDAELPMGRSFMVKSGRTYMVQVATPYANDDEIEKSLDGWVSKISQTWNCPKAKWERQPVDPAAEAAKQAAEAEAIRAKLRGVGITDDLMATMDINDLRNMASGFGIEAG